MTVEEIKSHFRLRDEITARGIEINRQGFCRCPFHSGDDSPSLKVYDSQNSWHCYGCGEGGDIIDFVRRIDGLSFSDACKAISGEEITRAGKYSIQRKQAAKRAAERRKIEEKKRASELRGEICRYWQKMKTEDQCGDEWAQDYNRWQYLTYKESVLEGREMMET